MRVAPVPMATMVLALLAVGPVTTLSAQSTLDARRTEILDFGSLGYQQRLGDAAERGLVWLASAQDSEGFWNASVGHKQGDNYMVFTGAKLQQARGHGHVGVTSLAALAFLSGGHIPGRGPYGDQVRRALDYILAHTNENGYITDGGLGDNGTGDSGTRMYSHAFATLFLAQIYGMIGEPRIKNTLERAVHWIVDCQNAQGAWRYNPFTREADLSMTVCQLQALRAARNIGIRVPKSTVDRAVAYVVRSRTDAGRAAGLFYYKIVGRGAYRKNQQYAINSRRRHVSVLGRRARPLAGGSRAVVPRTAVRVRGDVLPPPLLLLVRQLLRVPGLLPGGRRAVRALPPTRQPRSARRPGGRRTMAQRRRTRRRLLHVGGVHDPVRAAPVPTDLPALIGPH